MSTILLFTFTFVSQTLSQTNRALIFHICYLVSSIYIFVCSYVVSTHSYLRNVFSNISLLREYPLSIFYLLLNLLLYNIRRCILVIVAIGYVKSDWSMFTVVQLVVKMGNITFLDTLPVSHFGRMDIINILHSQCVTVLFKSFLI